MQHDAGAGRHEQQREVLQKTAGAVTQLLTNRAAHEQNEEKQRHTDDGAGKWPAEGAYQQFADKLE